MTLLDGSSQAPERESDQRSRVSVPAGSSCPRCGGLLIHDYGTAALGWEDMGTPVDGTALHQLRQLHRPRYSSQPRGSILSLHVHAQDARDPRQGFQEPDIRGQKEQAKPYE